MGRPDLLPTDEDLACFASHAREWGLQATPAQLERLRVYIGALLRWNERMNLTGASGPREILLWHVLDSLAATRDLEGAEDLLDVGSGAGLPGIPIKIFVPTLRVVLLEARRKKVSFLIHVVDKLQLENVEVIWGRMEEDPARALLGRSGFDAIMARASVPAKQILALGRELLRPGGRLLLMKGALGAREVESLGREAAGLGWGSLSVRPYRLPGAIRCRNVVRIVRGTRQGGDVSRETNE